MALMKRLGPGSNTGSVGIAISVDTNVSIVRERDGTCYAQWNTDACSGRVKLPPEEIKQPVFGNYRIPLWQTLNTVQAFAEQAAVREDQWRRICKSAFRPLQQLLGNARAGFEYDGNYAELCAALRDVEQQFQLAQQPAPDVEPKNPPEWWKSDKAATSTRTTLEKLKESVPTYPAREMALLLRLTVDSWPEAPPEALLRALKLIGIQAFFYEEAPEPLRQNPEYFGKPVDTPSPALVYQNGDKWMLLQIGTKRLIQE